MLGDSRSDEGSTRLLRVSHLSRSAWRCVQESILHFLAVLGIDEEINRLRQANDFLYILAGVVYYVRMLAIEIILLSTERED